MITAEEMFNANPILPEGVERQACIAFMKVFAELHAKAALKAASKNAFTIPTYKTKFQGLDKIAWIETDIVEDSILNAYPLYLIK